MASSLKLPQAKYSFEKISSSHEEPAAILLRGTEIADLIGGMDCLSSVQGWNLEVGKDFSSLDLEFVPAVLAATKVAVKSGDALRVRSNDHAIKVIPFSDGDGDNLTMLVFVPLAGHVTDLQEELHRLRSNLELTLHQSKVGIIEFNRLRPDWCFTEHIELLLGVNRGHLESRVDKFLERIHPEDSDISDKCRDLRLQAKEARFELRIKDCDGDYRWFAIVVPANPYADRAKTKWRGTIADIDDLKNSQLDSAAQVDRRDEFLAMLSHELRNPLMAIRYSVDLLTDFKQARATSGEFLRIISRQTSQMSRLLDDLLDVSRVVQNRLEFDFANHNLNDAIKDVIETVRSSIVEKSQSIRVQLCEENAYINGDITRVKQAIINLLENASKYTGEKGQLKVVSSVQGNQVCVEIRDNGIGVEKKDQSRIFDLFYQKENNESSKPSRGMGVGLFLVKSVLDKHGGRVTVDSDGVGCGSTFRLYLPLVSKLDNKQDASVKEYSVGRKTVCLIEDIADSRIALKILLEHRGFEVFEFADAESALEEIPGINPDAAIIDIGLPGRSGLEVANELRNKHGLKDMLMIALTGYGQEADCKEIDRVGFDRHLIKPAGIRKVCQVISDFFEPVQELRRAA